MEKAPGLFVLFSYLDNFEQAIATEETLRGRAALCPCLAVRSE